MQMTLAQLRTHANELMKGNPCMHAPPPHVCVPFCMAAHASGPVADNKKGRLPLGFPLMNV